MVSIEDKAIKKWYKENLDSTFLGIIVWKANRNGYVLDNKSGLLFRNVYSDEIIKRLNYTIIDIIFPRPIDLHYHKDVDEAFRVLNGEGVFCMHDSVENTLHKGKQLFVPKNVLHSFMPNKDDFLEIRVACSGILDPAQEVCEKRFDEFQPWLDYYKQFKK